MEQVAASQRDEKLRSRIGTVKHNQDVSRLVEAQRSMRERAGPLLGCRSRSSRSKRIAKPGAVSLAEFKHVAILTDGAACLVKFGLVGWGQILATLGQEGSRL